MEEVVILEFLVDEANLNFYNIRGVHVPLPPAAWRNGIASDYDRVIRRLQVRPLRWSFFCPLGKQYATTNMVL